MFVKCFHNIFGTINGTTKKKIKKNNPHTAMWTIKIKLWLLEYGEEKNVMQKSLHQTYNHIILSYCSWKARMKTIGLTGEYCRFFYLITLCKTHIEGGSGK